MTKRAITPESVVLRAAMRAFKQVPGLAFVWRNNVGGASFGKYFVRFGMPGAPDIIGVTRSGRFLGCECKSSVGGLSEAQAAFKQHVEAMGGLYFLVAGSGDIADMIKTLEAQ